MSLVKRRCPRCWHHRVAMDPLPRRDDTNQVQSWRFQCPRCDHVWIEDAIDVTPA